LAGNPGADGLAGAKGFGIFVKKQLFTGDGRDVVDARDGGFGGGGTIDLGSGNDQAFGFGQITLNGGTGIDALSLPGQVSDYTTAAIAGGTAFTKDGITMQAIGFERIFFLG
jgi:hypothetical protein